MSNQRLELAAVVREHKEALLEKWGQRVGTEQRQALRDIGACRTAALGGHLESCSSCTHRSIQFNSCRNRHCPKCQSTARDRWLAARAEELLPVAYCHVIFTVVGQLHPVALANQRVFYRLLFRAAAETLLQVASNPRLLGARIGLLAVLHTWNQTLGYHPHIHCLAPAGGLSSDGRRWMRSPKKFFLPVAVLRVKFRGKLLALLKQAFAQGELRFPGRLAELANPSRFATFLAELRRIDWVVWVNKPLRRPEHVLKYLARAIPIARRSRTVAWSRAKTIMSTSAAVTHVRATVARSWLWTRSNSCAASCCMYCPKASSASATSACSPIGIARPL